MNKSVIKGKLSPKQPAGQAAGMGQKPKNAAYPMSMSVSVLASSGRVKWSFTQKTGQNLPVKSSGPYLKNISSPGRLP